MSDKNAQSPLKKLLPYHVFFNRNAIQVLIGKKNKINKSAETNPPKQLYTTAVTGVIHFKKEKKRRKKATSSSAPVMHDCLTIKVLTASTWFIQVLNGQV